MIDFRRKIKSSYSKYTITLDFNNNFFYNIYFSYYLILYFQLQDILITRFTEQTQQSVKIVLSTYFHGKKI